MISIDLLRLKKNSALLVFFVFLFSVSHATAADYIYLHCNATGWDLSSATQMTEAGSPGKYEIIYDVAQNWMTQSGDNCIVIRTGVHNQWTSDVVRLTGNSIIQSVPFGPLSMIEGSSPFRVIYPEPGSYRATLNWTDKTLFVEHLEPPPESNDDTAQNVYFVEPDADMFILRPGAYADAQYWRYTLESPASDWYLPDFNADTWSSGQPGFWSGAAKPEDTRRTEWPPDKDDIWLRAQFNVTSADDIENILLWTRWDDRINVYINGIFLLYNGDWSPGYRYFGMSAAVRNTIQVGTNTIAVQVKNYGGDKYFDLGIVKNEILSDRPVSGFEASTALAAFTSTVRQFMVEHGIPGGQATVIKGNQIVLDRGFGWVDRELTTPIATDAVMRLASNDKPITAAMIQHMISTGFVDPVTGQPITLETAVFPLLQQHGLVPLAGTVANPESSAITIANLLNHYGGLRELPSPEDFYLDTGVVPGTSTAQDNVSWVFTQGPQFTPGSMYKYSSSGYMMLRHLIETLTGSFIDYTRSTLNQTTTNADIHIASEREEQRAASEPWYATLEQYRDNWIYLDNCYALASSSEALARIAATYNLFTGARLPPPDSGSNALRFFYGAYGGTWSVSMQQTTNEIYFTVIFNIVGRFDSLASELHTLLNTIPDDGWGI